MDAAPHLRGQNFRVGDNTADAVLEYAAMLGQGRTADTIDLNAIDADGDEVQATMFLSAGVRRVSEWTSSTLPEPDNTAALIYIQGRLALQVSPAPFDTDPFFDEHEDKNDDDGFGTLG